MALSAPCVSWKERAPDTAVSETEMSLEDKMERTRRDFWTCVFYSGSVCTYPGSASGSWSICSAPLLPVSNHDCTKPTPLQNVFSLKTSVYFISKKKKKEKSLKTFWAKTHSRNSPESLRLFSFDYCGYATLRGTARIADGFLCIPPLITVGTNVMGTLNQECYLGWVFWGSGM